MNFIEPDWPKISGVGAFATTRRGGVSEGPWASLNLGARSGDDPKSVAINRRRLIEHLPAEPCWLSQVHGTEVIHLSQWRPDVEADAAWTDRSGEVVVIQAADCLPVLLAARDGSFVAGLHGGWRSLAGGIVERTLAVLPAGADRLCAWIGPGICGRCYQVGSEVREAFLDADPSLEVAFESDGSRWRADLKRIVSDQLLRAGATVFDAGLCSYEDAARFYSFRRDRRTGRMAGLIWLS